jgi:hypothetical protein
MRPGSLRAILEKQFQDRRPADRPPVQAEGSMS